MVASTTDIRPFQLPNPFTTPWRRFAFRLARPALERILLFPKLNDLYRICENEMPDEHPWNRMLRTLDMRYVVAEEDLARIPKTGPLIVVANHPHGTIDGILLLSLLNRVRPDVRFVANFLLRYLPNIRESFFFVDPFGMSGSADRNLSGLRQSIEHVKQGGVLGMFPSGEVSHASLTNAHVHDPMWNHQLARMVRRTGASVLPIFIEGTNSLTFQLAGMIHPHLRTMLLSREMLRKRSQTIPLRVGNVIPFSRLERFHDDGDMTDYIRVRTYILKGRPIANASGSATEGEGTAVKTKAPVKHQFTTDIAPPPPQEALLAEVEAARQRGVLCSNGNLEVMMARAAEIPHLMQEIGRQREITFRAVGEGTGMEIDLDRFDDYYIHLFAWDKEANQLVGAYRLGPSDEIIPRFGVRGFYTRTLFLYDQRLIDQISPSVEMGRSFVVPAYQKSYSPLMLLWKGIGQFVAANPRYKTMFGPVSISNDYQSMTKQILMSFLNVNRYLPSLGKLIRPTHPPKLGPIRDWDPAVTARVVQDISEVDELVSEIEADRLGVPVLLRQYLKLDAKLLGFNVDPRFGDVLDGLLLVDVTKVNRTTLDRYMGKDKAAAYLAHHES